MLQKPSIKCIDLGLSNGTYFHYVVASGAITSISYTTSQALKNRIGRKAYYLSALRRLPRVFKGIPLRIESDNVSDIENAAILLVSKSPNVGGFKNIIPAAKFDDGLLHVLIIRKSSLFETLRIFLDVLKCRHYENPKVRYFTSQKVQISKVSGDEVAVGIDGEDKGVLPVEINLQPNALRIMVPGD